MISKKTKLKAKKCEDYWKVQYKKRGFKIGKMNLGGDFTATKGRDKRIVEVKFCGGLLSPVQKITKQIAPKVGIKFDLKRCGCDRF